MELTDLLAILRRHRLFAAVCFLLVLAASALLALVPAPTYSATVKVLVVPNSAANAGSDVQVLQFVVAALPDVVGSQDFAQRVERRLPPGVPTGTATITASSDQNTGQLTLSVASHDRAVVQPWANAAATLISGPDGGPVSTIAKLVVLNPAGPPTSSTSTRPLVLAGGVLLALLAALLLPVQLARWRNRANVLEYIPRRFNVPVLGTVPTRYAKTGPLDADGDRSGQMASSFEVIRLAMLIGLRRRPARALTLLAPSPGEGTTSVTASLARALEAAGTPVVVLGAETSGAQIEQILGEQAVVPGAVRALAPGTGRAGAHAVDGGRRPSPLARLDGGWVEEDPDELVLVDGPAFTDSAAASAAALATEAVILVVDVRRHGVSDIGRLASRLNLLGVRVVGVVLNHAGPEGRPMQEGRRPTSR